MREMAARVAELEMRTLFENFTYRYGGLLYKQASGGPIGARVTMATARLVMISWGANNRITLESSRMWLGILAGYVDDVRQDGTGIGMGKKI